MRLTKFTDYSLRVLLYAASLEDQQLTTVEETAKVFGISRAHLKKVVLLLTQNGFLEGVRGRTGGYRLARPAEEINLGAVIRVTEPDFAVLECFLTGNACRITVACRLPLVVNKALDAFVTTFDAYTLADMKIEARHFDAPVQPEYPQRGPKLSGVA
jgi:Rrf2 family transcriptional regulator, nitric oxide-sensitive transcriptional repressor